MIDVANMIEKSEVVASRLKLIANANRLRIACRVLQSEISVGDLEVELDIRQPTLSREISKLREGGVITARRESKTVFYTLTDPDMRQLIEAICDASAGKNVKGNTPPHASAIRGNFNPRPKFIQAAIHDTSEIK